MSGSRSARLGAIAGCLLAGLAALGFANQVGAVPLAGSNRAVVVVETDSVTTTRCVRFEGTIDGIEALQLAGIPAVTAAYGGLGNAVCSLDGTGCSATNCLECDAPNFWHYFRAPGGSDFSSSLVGASLVQLNDGDVEGWVWGATVPPPALPDVDAVCGPGPPPPSPAPPDAEPPSQSAPAAPPVPSPPVDGGSAAAAEPTTTTDLGTADPDPTIAGSTVTSSTTAPEDATTTTAPSPAELAAATTDAGSGGGVGGGSWYGVLAVTVLAGALAAWALLRRRTSA